SVFLTHDWLFTWWKHLAEGRGLAIVIARERDNLVGILPLALKPANLVRLTPQMLEFLGSGIIGSDYLDVIVRSGDELQVVSAFSEFLDHTSHIVQLSQLRRGACVSEVLARTLNDRGWTVNDANINLCPFIDVQGRTWEGYLTALSSS